jgi:hypothetical protein
MGKGEGARTRSRSGSVARCFAGLLCRSHPPIDNEVADAWGRLSAMRSVPAIDALLAATAKVRRMTLVTRNVSDFADLGADMLNPFEPVVAGRS